MTVTVSKPSNMDKAGDTDPSVSIAIQDRLWYLYKIERSKREQDTIAWQIAGLQNTQVNMEAGGSQVWWDNALGSSTPTNSIPSNVVYGCDATLGNPSVPNCEAASFEFFEEGTVVLDPAAGPIIKVVG